MWWLVSSFLQMRSVLRKPSSALREQSSALLLVRRSHAIFLVHADHVPASIYLAIYTGRLNTNLPSRVVEYATNAGLPASSTTDLLTALGNGTTAAYEQVPGSNAGIVAAIADGTKSAHASSLSVVYLASLAFAGTALISAFFLTSVKKYMTGFVNKQVDGKSRRVDKFDDADLKHEA